jgi:hypothetical protein
MRRRVVVVVVIAEGMVVAEEPEAADGQERPALLRGPEQTW